jgi:hypothetical protein
MPLIDHAHDMRLSTGPRGSIISEVVCCTTDLAFVLKKIQENSIIVNNYFSTPSFSNCRSFRQIWIHSFCYVSNLGA